MNKNTSRMRREVIKVYAYAHDSESYSSRIWLKHESPGVGQAPVVQRADNFFQWINRYPTDKMHSNQYILSAG